MCFLPVRQLLLSLVSIGISVSTGMLLSLEHHACTNWRLSSYSLPPRGNIVTLKSCADKDMNERLPLCVEEVQSCNLLLERNNVVVVVSPDRP